MAVTIRSNANIVGDGGAVVETAAGVKYAVVHDSSVADETIYVYKNIDTTPVLEDSDTSLTILGSANGITHVDAALDSNDDIHIVVAAADATTRDVSYAIFDSSAGTIGAWELVASYTDGAPSSEYVSICIDSSDVPRVVFVDGVLYHGSDLGTITYMEKDGSWSTPEIVSTDPFSSYTQSIVQVDSADDCHVFYEMDEDPHYRKRNGTWGTEDVGTANAARGSLDLAISGTTPWFTAGGATYNIVEGNDVDSLVDTGYYVEGNDPRLELSICYVGTDRYIFYIDVNEDVHLISNAGSGWTDEGVLHTGTYGAVVCQWSYNNDNRSGEINYIFDDVSAAYYDSFTLPQAFPPVPARVLRDYRSVLLRM